MLTSMEVARLVYGASAVLYLALCTLILMQSQLSRTGLLLFGACLVTALWLGAVALDLPPPFGGFGGGCDLLRSVGWYVFLLHLYSRSIPGRSQLTQAFVVMGVVAVLVVGVSVLVWRPGQPGFDLWSAGTALRLGLAVCNILLIENLYFNTLPDEKWRINLPSIALGSLAVYDIALSADAVLLRQVSGPLFVGNAIAAAIVVPLLAVSAARNRGWQIDIHVSRTVVFHSATLIASGVFLLGLAAVGEAFRYFGADWAGLAEISLVFAGLVTISVLLTSASARSHIRRFVVDHFFSHRYDYRREWVRCINTLSAQDAYIALHTRVIRAVADVVDSPGGVLFLREASAGAAGGASTLQGGVDFQWAGSWNMPAFTSPVMADDPLVTGLRGGNWIAVRSSAGQATDPDEFGVLADTVPSAWLAIPLSHGGVMTGFIVVARARAAFTLDREVYDLLRIVGRQVATYVAEQRATEVLLQARQLHDYGKRFAFVAHDIKNVSSQLSMLLANAEVHLSNPEFQRDMLSTVRASVQKISGLLKRLQGAPTELTRTIIRPRDRLEALLSALRRPRTVDIRLEDGGGALGAGGVAMPAASFDAVVTHLLDNAVEATLEANATQAVPIVVRLYQEGRRLLVDIADGGPGMTPEFVRDKLFVPFDTSKPGGSGIGAYQARELLREAGGDLLVLSRPGAGTTMRLVLPTVEAPGPEPDRGTGADMSMPAGLR